jgi:hypothetical protein
MGMISRALVIAVAATVLACGRNDACMPTSLDRIICAGDTDCAGDAGDAASYCDTGHEVVVDNCEGTAHVCAARDAGE